MQTDTRAKRNQRTQFLFFYSYGVQLFFMWILSRVWANPGWNGHFPMATGAT